MEYTRCWKVISLIQSKCAVAAVAFIDPAGRSKDVDSGFSEKCLNALAEHCIKAYLGTVARAISPIFTWTLGPFAKSLRSSRLFVRMSEEVSIVGAGPSFLSLG